METHLTEMDLIEFIPPYIIQSRHQELEPTRNLSMLPNFFMTTDPEESLDHFSRRDIYPGTVTIKYSKGPLRLHVGSNSCRPGLLLYFFLKINNSCPTSLLYLPIRLLYGGTDYIKLNYI